jgi:hypothetical protein
MGLDGFADELRAMADEMDAAAQRDDVVYQIAKKDDPASQAWVDVDTQSWEDAGFFQDDFQRRRLYTTPPASQEQHNVQSSAGLIRPGKVDAWVANHYTTPPAAQPAPVQEPMPFNDSHIDSLIESAIQGHAGTRDAMRWLVRAVEAHYGITKEQA